MKPSSVEAAAMLLRQTGYVVTPPQANGDCVMTLYESSCASVLINAGYTVGLPPDKNPEDKPRIAPGDVVTLRSGGPEMTVRQRGQCRSAFDPEDNMLECDWFTRTGHESRAFHSSQLKKVR